MSAVRKLGQKIFWKKAGQRMHFLNFVRAFFLCRTLLSGTHLAFYPRDAALRRNKVLLFSSLILD